MSENIEVIKSIEAPIILDTPTNEPNLTIDLLKRKFEHLDEEIKKITTDNIFFNGEIKELTATNKIFLEHINQINAQCNKSSCEIKNIPEKNTICNKISRCFRKRKISIIN
jgi:hypothetical protein